MLMEKFRFIEKLGRGAHGTVYLLETTDGRGAKVVCKSILEKYQRHAEREIRMLSSLTHKRIVGMIESFQTDKATFIILEHANHGTLESIIKFFIQNRCKATTHLIWSVLAQVADGLTYLHSRKIIHRDVKPSNILINQLFIGTEEFLEFKLCDFSLARRFEETEEQIFGNIVGTPSYMAPEMVSRNAYNASVDVWGLGVTLYELATLRKPFKGESRGDLYNSIREARVSPTPICMDKTLSNLIRRCLHRENRISIRAISRNKNVRLHLAMVEIRLREYKIQSLERIIDNLRASRPSKSE